MKPPPQRARTCARRSGPAVVAALALLGTAAARSPAASGPAPGQPGTADAVGVIAPGGTHRVPVGVIPPADSGPGAPVPPAPATEAVAPLHKLLHADVLIVAHSALPATTAAKVTRLPGVQAANALDAARVQVNGKYIAVLGVDPSAFRAFSAGPTAAASRLWQNVAAGDIAVSYTMGKQDKLPLGGAVQVAGRTRQALRVGGYGTVGIGGVDAVVSDAVARSLGFPAGNAIVVSAPHAQIPALVRQIKAQMPPGALVEPLVTTAASGRPAAAGVAGASVTGSSAAGSAAGSSSSPGLSITGVSSAQILAMLRAAVSRVGMPYVWGAAGPGSFDCSGLVLWSYAQAGVVMPRVAADQARTGPAVPPSQAQPGDLLFYRTDPTAPDYISHVAIFLGKGLMIQAPQPGQNVEIVPADFGNEFAGVVRVSPAIAAQVAASPVG